MTPIRHEPLAWICTREELQHMGDGSAHQAVVSDTAAGAAEGLMRMTGFSRDELMEMVAQIPDLTWQEDPVGLAQNLNALQGVYEFTARTYDMRHTDTAEMETVRAEIATFDAFGRL